MRPWTETYPERLAYELAEFERRGLRFEPDQAALDKTAALALRGSIIWRERAVELVVVYPDSFPFLRPEVYAPDLKLERHQSPIERNLCLLDRSSRAWHVSDTGAWLVAVRVPHLLDLLELGGEDLLAGEAPQGEPESYYFPGQVGAVVFVPAEMLNLQDSERVGILELAFGQNEPPQQMLRGCLAKLAVRSRKGKKRTLAEVGKPLRTRFAGERLEGRWVRLDRFPSGNQPADLLNAVAAVQPAFSQHHWHQLSLGVEISILGAVVPEEVRQGEWEDTWLFLVSLRRPAAGATTCYIARGERLTADDLRARLPAETRLESKRIGVVGLGALGAPLTTELLRSQVGELRILDGDRVEAGNIVRWPLGISAVGHDKAALITAWGLAEYPFTRTLGWTHRIGAVRPDATPPSGAVPETTLLTDFLDGLDVLVDATAELGVQHLLSTLADDAGIPQVYAWGTEGGWGGAIARVMPGQTGCWHCLQLALGEGTIMLPPGAPAAAVQPRGCATPTFAAASYALSPIVAQAGRVIARTLRGEGRYDVFICELENEDGELEAPRWTSYALKVHAQCPCVHHAVAA